jgi:hypothetical protein
VPAARPLHQPAATMDPRDPAVAQQIVIEYVHALERDLSGGHHPARVDSLPYAKPVIEAALRTSVGYLAHTGQLTEELRAYFETAYVSLAEYVEVELAQLMTEYRRSAEQLTAEPVRVGDKTTTAAWRTLAGSGAIAGEVARAATAEADERRETFQKLLVSIGSPHRRSV